VNGTEDKAERDRHVTEFVKEVNSLMREQASSLRAARAKGQKVADAIRARVSEFSNRPEVRQIQDRIAVAPIEKPAEEVPPEVKVGAIAAADNFRSKIKRAAAGRRAKGAGDDAPSLAETAVVPIATSP
jgi:hypothetical protein